MPAPLPPELRERVVAHHKATGLGRIHLGRIFSLGSSTAYRWIKLEEATGSVEPKECAKRGAGPKIPDDKLDALRELVAEKPDRILKELCACWFERFGVSVSVAAMHRTLGRAKITLKKKPNASQTERGRMWSPPRTRSSTPS